MRVPRWRRWKKATNLIHNEGFGIWSSEADDAPMSKPWVQPLSAENGWGELRLRLGGGVNVVEMGVRDGASFGGTHPAVPLSDDEIDARARELVEFGGTGGANVLVDDDIRRFFRRCDELREQGKTIGVITKPVRAGRWPFRRAIPAGTECEMVASFTWGESILRHRGREFSAAHDDHYLVWRWDI